MEVKQRHQEVLVERKSTIEHRQRRNQSGSLLPALAAKHVLERVGRVTGEVFETVLMIICKLASEIKPNYCLA